MKAKVPGLDTDLEPCPSRGETESVAAAIAPGYAKLRAAGLDYAPAVRIAKFRALFEIENQIRWLARRPIVGDPIRTLQSALEELWPEPRGQLRELKMVSPPLEEKGTQSAHERAAIAHRELFQRSWLEYLMEREEQLKGNQPERYAEFAKDQSVDPSSKSDHVRLPALQKYFSSDGVLDFWDWDEDFNIAGFRSKENIGDSAKRDSA